MSLEEERILFHKRASSLVGHAISRVRYSTIDYEDGKPHWDYVSFHNAELGVELTTTEGTIFHIGWDWVFCHYGIAILQVVEEGLWTERTVMWDVTVEPCWSQFIGEGISEVKTYWCKTGDKAYLSPEYPQDLEITFESGRKVWFLAAGYEESKGQVYRMYDEVVIAFDEGVIAQHQFGAYTPKEWLHRTVVA